MGVATRCVITIMTSIKMNKYKMIWGVLMASLLGLILGGCSKELGRGGNGEVPGLPEKGQAVTFTVTTGVETYAVPAQDYEKSISTLQAILFDANGLYVTSGTPAPTAPGSASYTLPIATTGSYKMLLVANHTIPAGNLTGKTLSGVRAILVDSEPGMPNAFVMASTTTTDFTVTTGATAPAGTINLERLAARIDVQSTLDKLTLSKITVKNRKTQSSLLAASSTDAYAKADKEYTSFARFLKASTDVSMGQIYTYENSAASASSADGTSLVIETAYNGYAVKPLEVKLPQLKRNYIYSIQLMMGDEGFVPDPSDNPDPSKIKLTYNVRVVDWNNGQTFTVSEEDLLKIFQKGAVSYSYTFAVTTTPDISKGVSADGGAAVINATATKQKLVGGTPDPTAPAETITGGDKFTYKVVGNPAPWITISPAGAITVSANTTNASRAATIEIALKEDPSQVTHLLVNQQGKTPEVHVRYSLDVNPKELSFPSTGDSQLLTVKGRAVLTKDGKTMGGDLDISDVTIEKSAGADWLTVAADGTVTAAKNGTTEARQATLTIAVKKDPSVTTTVAVSQAAADVTEYTLTGVIPAILSFSKFEGSTVKPITISGKVSTLRSGQEIDNRPMTVADVLIEKPTSGAEWLSVNNGVISVTANNSGMVRQTSLTIKVKEDATQIRTLTVTQRATNDDNPLAYVAHYNILSNGYWDTYHTMTAAKEEGETDVQMDWSTAMSKYGTARSIEGSTESYQLPTRQAWNAIVLESARAASQSFGSGDILYNQTERVLVGGQIFDATGDYMPTTMVVNGSNVKCNVALRFNGGGTIEHKYRSAWLYYWGTNVVRGKRVNGLWIYCVNISGRLGFTTVHNLDQAFWDQNLSSAVVRFFPAAGGGVGYLGEGGEYWSASDGGVETAYYMGFSTRGVSVNYTNSRLSRDLVVRLFSSEPLD